MWCCPTAVSLCGSVQTGRLHLLPPNCVRASETRLKMDKSSEQVTRWETDELIFIPQSVSYEEMNALNYPLFFPPLAANQVQKPEDVQAFPYLYGFSCLYFFFSNLFLRPKKVVCTVFSFVSALSALKERKKCLILWTQSFYKDVPLFQCDIERCGLLNFMPIIALSLLRVFVFILICVDDSKIMHHKDV